MNLNSNDIKELLEQLHDRFNCQEFVEHDPISIPHRFSRLEDIEIAGFLSATIAWGNRKAIVKSAGRMMEYLDHAPFDFVMNASEAELERIESYVHRTFCGSDFRDFIVSLRRIYQQHGSMKNLFEQRYSESQSLGDCFAHFRSEFLESPHQQRCEKHISSITKGAACKRLCMYLRWMVRKDSRGVDFGVWSGIPSSALYIPLDVHSGNVARKLTLLTRKQSDWKAVDELTSKLREFDINDPVKYDFALFGAGIEGVL